MNIEVRKVYRSSNIIGTPVQNSEGESLGKIEEVVADLENNSLSYAVLSCGGFMGVGNKLFAIPWTDLCLTLDEDSTYFVLDLEAEKLKSAPGFDKDRWPNTTDPDWAKEIDRYYDQAKDDGQPHLAAGSILPDESKPPEETKEKDEQRPAEAQA